MDSRSFVTIAGVLTTTVSAYLALQAVSRRRRNTGAVAFAALMAATAFWTAVYTWEITSGSLTSAILGLKVEYLAVAAVPLFWYWFARSLSGIPARKILTSKTMGLLAAIPLVTVGLMATNEFHSLVYTGYALRPDTDLTILVGQRGPWYWIHVAGSYLLMVLGTYWIVRKALSAAGRIRGQLVLLVAAALLPWTGHLLLLFRATPGGMDLTPFLFSLSGVVLTVALYQFRLFDLVPVARDLVVDAIRDGVVVLDEQLRIVDYNRAAQAAFPELGGRLVGTPADQWFATHGWVLPEAEADLDHGDATKKSFHVTRLSLGSRTSPGGCVLLFSDVTETKELWEQMRRLASTDMLTGLDNRRMFFDHANREVDRARRQGTPLSFALVDVDLFKSINDRFGHASGDEALVSLAQLLRANLRTSDIVCRYGGEEFTMIFPDTPPREAAEVAERVRQASSELSLGTGESRFRLTISIGITGTDGGQTPDVEALVHSADMALYRAKARGRNRVVVTDDFSPVTA